LLPFSALGRGDVSVSFQLRGIRGSKPQQNNATKREISMSNMGDQWLKRILRGDNSIEGANQNDFGRNDQHHLAGFTQITAQPARRPA